MNDEANVSSPPPQATGAEGASTSNRVEENSFLSGEAEIYRRNMQSGARWFYWIAGLSLINAIAAAANSNWSFLAGLGITQFISGFMRKVCPQIWVRANVVMVIAFSPEPASGRILRGAGSVCLQRPYVGVYCGLGDLCAGRADLFSGPALVSAGIPRFRYLLPL